MDRKTLIAATVGFLVVALVLSMVTVSIEEDTEGPGSITVPVGNLGDRVVYQAYDEDGRKAWMHEHQVGGTVETLDGTLDPTKAIVIKTTWSKAGYPPFTFNEPVRLTDRAAVQHQITNDAGPYLLNMTLFQQNAPFLPVTELQGVELSIGDTVELSKRTSRQGGHSFYAGSGSAALGLGLYYHPITHFQYRPSETSLLPLPTVEAEASLAGTLDGEPVLGLVHEEVITDPHELNHPDQEETYVLAEIRTTYWLNEQVPYPLLIDRNVSKEKDDGTVEYGGYHVILVEHDPGDGQIPWGETADTEIELTRSPPEGLRPADGEGSQLAYPLSRAVKDVDEYGLDPEWLAWKTLNPNAMLVTAVMTQGATTNIQDDAVEWRLIFEDEAEAFEVRTERGSTQSHPVVEAMGEAKLPAGPRSPPRETLTVSSLIDLWQKRHGTTPTFFQWGIVPENGWNPSTLCVMGISHQGRAKLEPQDMIHQVQIGRASPGMCPTDDSTKEHHAMVVDIVKRRLLVDYHTLSDFWSEEGPSWEEDNDPNPTIEPYSSNTIQSMSIGSPQFDEKSAVALPILVIMVTLWFLPAIQFAATKGLLLLPAFSRIKKSQVLDHGLRDQIHTLVRENPGITPSHMKKETGAGWGTIVYHLAVMEREELVASRVEGRHRRFFIAEEVHPGERHSLAVLANERTQEIYSSLLDSPGLATPELAQRIGLSPPGALWHLKRLEQTGLVQRKRDGRYVRYYPAPDFRSHEQKTPVEAVKPPTPST